jgi:hypothetical protein
MSASTIHQNKDGLRSPRQANIATAALAGLASANVLSYVVAQSIFIVDATAYLTSHEKCTLRGKIP